MLSVVVHGARDLRVEERPAPQPGPGQVLVDMTHGGICGSDLHYYLDGAVGAFTLREPLTLGHEVVGTVAHAPPGEPLGAGGAAGAPLPVDPGAPRPAVPPPAPGTPVALHPGTACGSCPECRSRLPHVCRDSRYLGSAASTPHTQGGFTGQLAVDAGALRVLPAGLPLERAVLAEPLAVALHALSRTGGVAGARVLVSGAGPIGALTAGAAKAAGAEEVWATDLLDAPLRIAERVGAGRTLRADGEEPLPREHFDVAVEASGAPAALGPVLDAVKRRGVVVQLGSLPAGPTGAALAALVAKEVALLGSFRFGTELDDAVAVLASTDVLDAVITHSFPLEEAVTAMEVAADPAASGKVVLRLDGGHRSPGGSSPGAPGTQDHPEHPTATAPRRSQA